MSIAELIIAWRYLRTRRREKFISVTAVFSFIGIALGVATLIIVTSVMNGFQEEFTTKIVGFNGQLTAYVRDTSIDIDQVVSDLEKMDEVEKVIPVLERHALSSNGRQIRGALVCGISKQYLDKYNLITNNIILGDIKNFNDEDTVLIGSSLANIYNINIGDELSVLTPELEETGLGMFPIKKTFKISGIFKSGMHEYDSNAVIIPLEMAQKLFGTNGPSNLLIFTKKSATMKHISSTINSAYGFALKVVDCMQNNSAFMNAVKVEKNVMFLILTLITLVAGFNIISCMIMLVKDKERDIAILKTLGFSNRAILRIFFMIGSAIGGVGTIIGAIGGVTFATYIENIRRFLEHILSMNLFPGEVYFLTQLPSVIHYTDVGIVVFFALLITCLATLYPAIKASKLSPSEVLKYE